MVQAARIDFPGVVKRRLACLLIDVIQGDIDNLEGAIALLRLLLTELEAAQRSPGSAHNVSN